MKANCGEFLQAGAGAGEAIEEVAVRSPPGALDKDWCDGEERSWFSGVTNFASTELVELSVLISFLAHYWDWGLGEQ